MDARSVVSFVMTGFSFLLMVTFGRMNQPPTSTNTIAYKWLSVALLGGFVYFWLFSLGNVLFKKSLRQLAPRQSVLYNAALKESWSLFSRTKFYNRQLNVVIRDTGNKAATDTIDLVNYCIQQKRKAAPFNGYYDRFEQLLFWTMNDLEMDILYHQKKLKRDFPQRPDSFYTIASGELLRADTARQTALQSLYRISRYLLPTMGYNTAGKEFQLQMQFTYIPPKHPPVSSLCSGDRQVVFISSFRSF